MVIAIDESGAIATGEEAEEAEAGAAAARAEPVARVVAEAIATTLLSCGSCMCNV
jgi:hypothetical protein